MKGFMQGRDTIHHDHWSRTLFQSTVGSTVGSWVEGKRRQTAQGTADSSGDGAAVCMQELTNELAVTSNGKKWMRLFQS